MLVQCKFKSKFNDEFAGRAYTYKCDYDAKVGDIVKVPAGSGEGIAKIVEINVLEYSVKSDVFPLLKTVIGPAEYEDSLFAETDAAELPALPETEIADNIIVIRQLPIIEDQLRELRATVEEKVKEALSLAVTDETVKAVKDVRAALNKEYKALEDRRKQVKLAILEPYDRFEVTYRECIGNLYSDADNKLKEKIDAVENGVKNAKREALQRYYEEYRATLNLTDEPISDFEGWNIKVNKTASDTVLRRAAEAYLTRIRSDLNTIAGMEHAEEILVEYKACRDLSLAISTVNERHRLAEEERKRWEEKAARKAEQEAREKEALEKVEAAVAKAEPAAPPVEVKTPEEPAKPEKDPNEIFKVVGPFVLLNVTRAQVIKFKEFLNQEGIQYGKYSK